jgi:acetyltransferase
MTIRNFDKLLTPKSIALIGASEQPRSIGRIVAENLIGGGFQGPIDFVNPTRSSIFSHTCHTSVAELRDAPDLAIIATPPETVPGLVRDLADRGTRAAVVLSAGVTPRLRQEMLDAARPHLFRVQGPNSLGLIRPSLGLNASFAHRMPRPGDLAFVSQSGALVTAVIDWASARGIGFSHVVSLGDMADADVGDFLDYLASDAQTRAILLYVEAITHARKFMSAARRAARSKPVVVLKSGRHASGAKAAHSHTGALAGSDTAYDAAFHRAGLLRVAELEDLFEAAESLSRLPPLAGERLLILTNGGGAGVLATDHLADLDGRLAELSDETRVALDTALPPTWSRSNPVDIIGDADAERYVSALDRLLDSRDGDALLIINCPTALASSSDIADAIISRLGQRRSAEQRLVPVFTNWLGDGAAADARSRFACERIASFDTPAAAIKGFMQRVRHARAQTALMQAPSQLPPDMTCDDSGARGIIARSLKRGQFMMSEAEAKGLLAAYGIPVVPTRIAANPEHVEDAARDVLTTAPSCVIKILSDDISHKSDAGGVRLDLSSPAEARAAAQAMQDRISKAYPDARLAGFTVQPMIRRPHAHELFAGMSVDTTFGPMLMFGSGGTSVEVVRDTVQALPPLDLKLAQDMMRSTRIMRLLEGYRDRPRAALDAIALTLVKLSALVIAHPEIHELDINPLLADADGVIALDARVRISDPAKHPRQLLSIRPYPARWEKQIEQAGIGPLLLRPIRPEDERLYVRLAERVTAEDIRMRFFAARPKAIAPYIARLTQIDYAREMAFVAIEQTSGDIIGVVRLIADPDYTRAEFAILVVSDLKGRGLGWALMQHLIAYACAEGLEELHGQVLAENETMLQMCRELGFTVMREPDDPGIMLVTLRLRH